MKSPQLNAITCLLMLIRGMNTISNCGQLATDLVIPLLTNSYRTHHWPWHAALYHQLNVKAAPIYKCGGSLITSNSILTAAHCVSSNNVPMQAKQVSVSLGKINLATTKATDQYFEVAEIIVHPDYSSIDYVNDIAIIKVTVYATFDNYVRPICLWNLNNTDLTEVIGKLGTVVGWGVTENDKISNVLLQASLPVVDTWTCLLSNRDIFGNLITKTNFCAGFRNGTSVCNGDSGGSMTFEDNGIYYIRGIVSVGTSKISPITGELICNPMEFALFTDVAQYLPWIIENTDVCETNVTCLWIDVHTCSVVIQTAKSTRNCKLIFDETEDETPNTNITAIAFSGESFVIPDISDAFTKFENLESLKLTTINIRSVESTRLTDFKKIRKLDLSANAVRELRFDTFDSLENLQSLHLSNNKLKGINVDLFKHLDNLEAIDLSGNQLTAIPATIFRNNEKLKDINLARNHLKELHSDIFKDLHNIEGIDFSYNKLTAIPANLFSLNKKLREIDLHSNPLNELQGDIFAELPSLEKLNLGSNKLKTIPGNIFRNNDKLKEINLQLNNLKALHSHHFQNLRNIEVIDLYGNELTTIPENIFRNNQQLQSIDLESNQLKELPTTLFKDLNNLEKIWLNDNQIEIIPQGLFDTNSKVKKIRLDHNKIKEIEVDFTQLTKLEELIFQGNACFDSNCDSETFCGLPSLIDLIKEIQKKC